MTEKILHIVAYNNDGQSFDIMLDRFQIEKWFSGAKDPKTWWVRINDQNGDRVGYKEAGEQMIAWEPSIFPGRINEMTALSEVGMGASASGILPRECKQEHSEGRIARSIEEQTSKLPSDIFLWAAFACIGLGAFLELTGKHEKSRWIGQWPTNIMLMGLYNKIVKVAGSDSCG